MLVLWRLGQYENLTLKCFFFCKPESTYCASCWFLTPVVLLQSKIRSRGMWPSQHEVSESLRTSKMAGLSKAKGFQIQYVSSVLTGRWWTPGRTCIYGCWPQRAVASCKVALCFDKRSVLNKWIIYSLHIINSTSLSVISLFSSNTVCGDCLFSGYLSSSLLKCTAGKSHTTSLCLF